jgi:hypothetical protein
MDSRFRGNDGQTMLKVVCNMNSSLISLKSLNKDVGKP